MLMLVMLLTGSGGDWSAGRILAAAFMLLVLGLVVWFQFSALPMTVTDHGSHLEVAARGLSAVVPLTAIREVEYKPVMLGNLVTLYLFEPGPLGAAIAYMPIGGFRRNVQQDVDDLRRRVLHARLG